MKKKILEQLIEMLVNENKRLQIVIDKITLDGVFERERVNKYKNEQDSLVNEVEYWRRQHMNDLDVIAHLTGLDKEQDGNPNQLRTS